MGYTCNNGIVGSLSQRQSFMNNHQFAHELRLDCNGEQAVAIGAADSGFKTVYFVRFFFCVDPGFGGDSEIIFMKWHSEERC